MLAKIFRLKKANDFRLIFQSGKLIRGIFFDFRFVENKETDCRVGFAVGLRISKHAVVRNKIKRNLSEAASFFIKKIKGGQDMLIIAKPNIVNQPQEEIIKDLENVIKKARLIE
jgi:ribonuclease P protein component